MRRLSRGMQRLRRARPQQNARRLMRRQTLLVHRCRTWIRSARVRDAGMVAANGEREPQRSTSLRRRRKHRSAIVPSATGACTLWEATRFPCASGMHPSRTNQMLRKYVSRLVSGGDALFRKAAVVDVLECAKKVLGAQTQFRALPLHNSLMHEAWSVLDPSYAADSYLMALSGVGEVMGPRYCTFYTSLRSNMTSSTVSSGMRWAQLYNKNNQTMMKRVRSMEHTCRLCNAPPGSLQWTEATAVEVDADFGILPETRCGLCSFLRYCALCDDDGGAPAAFRGLAPAAKLSFEKGAVPMDRRSDGTYSGTYVHKGQTRSWFQTAPYDLEHVNVLFRQWVKRINEQRHLRKPDMPKLDETAFRVYSLRHGAAYNCKRSQMNKVQAAAHLCMSEHVYEHVYGVEEGDEAGVQITRNLIGGATELDDLVRALRSAQMPMTRVTLEVLRPTPRRLCGVAHMEHTLENRTLSNSLAHDLTRLLRACAQFVFEQLRVTSPRAFAMLPEAVVAAFVAKVQGLVNGEHVTKAHSLARTMFLPG